MLNKFAIKSREAEQSKPKVEKSLNEEVVMVYKSHKLDYKDVAQLNMYLSYYRKNMMQEDDNPPVGILLCTAVGKEMVEYATSGIDENLFISKYLLKLPSKDEMERWLYKELKELR